MGNEQVKQLLQIVMKEVLLASLFRFLLLFLLLLLDDFNVNKCQQQQQVQSAFASDLTRIPTSFDDDDVNDDVATSSSF